jgi:membrane protein implicated in regulation of membrane protease activity
LANLAGCEKEYGTMQGLDGIRRNGYVIALAVGLVALFTLMTGGGWQAAGLVLAAMALIGIVEHVAAVQQRQSRRHRITTGG